MVWPTLGSRTAKEQYSGVVGGVAQWLAAFVNERS